MTLSVPGEPASCEKFPHSSQLNFWSTESIFNQFSVFLKTLNALCVCLQYKHARSIKRVIRSDKPVTLLLLFWLQLCDFGSERVNHVVTTFLIKPPIILTNGNQPLKTCLLSLSVSQRQVLKQTVLPLCCFSMFVCAHFLEMCALFLHVVWTSCHIECKFWRGAFELLLAFVVMGYTSKYGDVLFPFLNTMFVFSVTLSAIVILANKKFMLNFVNNSYLLSQVVTNCSDFLVCMESLFCGMNVFF
jgi:hypothetical protein